MAIPRINDIRFNSVMAPAKGHPVFILRGNPADPFYVVKKENFRAGYIEGVYVNPFSNDTGPNNRQHRDRQLDTVDEFKRSFQFMVDIYSTCLTRFPEFRVLDMFELANLFTRLAQCNQDKSLFDDNFIAEQRKNQEMVSSMWTVIDCLSGLYDFKNLVAKQLPNGDAPAREALRFIKNNPDTAAELGRIVALDAFVGNNDRVDWGYNYQARRFTWSPLNIGNFFVLCTGEGGHSTFCGIDFFDPNSSFSNLYGDFDKQNSNEGAPWPGTLLKQGEGEIRTQAGRVLDALNAHFQNAGYPALFTDQHKTAMAKGFKEGASALKKFVNKRTDKPPAIKRRKAILGW